MARFAGRSEHNLQSTRPRAVSDSELTIVSVSDRDVAETQMQTEKVAAKDVEATPVGPSQDPPGPPGGWLSQNMPRNHEIAFNTVICMVQLIPQACLTTCFPIIQILVRDFGIDDPAILPWVVAAYALSFGTTILLAGRLGDIFGHKNIVILGFSWLSLWSILGGLSRYSSHQFFFVTRAMQGVGSALMNPNALALLGRSYPPNSKGKIIAFSAFGLCAPLGAYAGLLGSAVLGQLVHWSWAFYALAIISAFLALNAAYILPSPPMTPKQMLPISKKLRSMDWLGGFTGVCGLVAIQVSLVSAPIQGWQTQWIFMCLIIGIIFISFFVVVELRVSVEPLVPFRLLNVDVGFVLVAMACGWGTFGVWTYYLWRFLLGIWQDTPLLATLHVLPIVPVALIASALTAVLMRKVRPAWILFGALVAFTLGPTFLAANTPNSIYWTFTFLSVIVTPFGMDMSFPSATFIMSNSLPMDKQGVAGSLVTTIVNYSISLGLGIASTVEVHINNQGLDVMQGIQSGWIFGIGLGGLGVVVCTGFVVKTYLFPEENARPNPTSPPPKIEIKKLRRRSGEFSSTSSTIRLSAEESRAPSPEPEVPGIPLEYLK